MKIGKAIIAVAALAAVTSLAACTSSGNGGGDIQESNQQQSDTTQMELVLPLPHFQYSMIRYEMIIEEATQAFGLSTTTFFFQQGDRTPVGECPSVGLPIPMSASLSNPWQPYNVSNNNGAYNTVAVGQMDPNGIYTGPTEGTNVLCKTANGGTYLTYAEENAHSVSAQAYWDPSMFGGKGGIHVVGQPQVPVCTDIRKTTYKDSNDNIQHGYSTMCYKPGHVPAGVTAPSFGS
jgi:hypothetical protein